MKILNFEVTKKNRAVVLLSAIGVAVALFYIFFCIPLTAQAQKKAVACWSVERQVLEARNIIAATGNYNGERVLLPEKDAALVISELTKHGRDMGVKITSMAPKDIVADSTEKYKILPIEMKVESSYEAMAEFIGSLGELEQSVIKIKGFDITSQEKNRSRLKANLVLDVYLSGENDGY